MKADELRKSILQLAIQGKLVKQDPNDEPASVLIKKIREEKQRLVKEGKIRKDKTESFIFRGADNSYYEKIGNETHCIDEEIPFEVPGSWEWCRMKNISQSYIGLTYAPKEVVQTGGIIVLRSSNIQNGKICLNDIVRVNKEINNKLFVSENDILICARNGSKKLVGKSAIIGKLEQPMTFGAFMAICKTPIYQYVYNFLQSDLFFNQLHVVSGTTTVNQLTQENFNNFVIPIPPIEEQQRIINQLEMLAPLIAKYDEYEKQEAQLTADFPDALKKSILQHAIQGKLVAQNPDDEPASALLDKIRKEKQQLIKAGKIKKDKNESVIYKNTDDNSYYEKIGTETRCIDDEVPFEIPESWAWARLGSLCNTIHYGFTASASPIGNSKLLRITDIQDNKVDWKSVPFCNVTKNELTTYKLFNNDILIARTGGTIGKTYIVNNLKETSVFASYLIRAIPNENICSAYLKCYMESPFYWQQLTEKSMGTGQPNVNGESLKSLLVPIPPFKEQKEIVKSLEKVFRLLQR